MAHTVPLEYLGLDFDSCAQDMQFTSQGYLFYCMGKYSVDY